MIVYREKERSRERRLSGARAAIFFLWVILVFALISLFSSIHNESSSNNNSSSHSIRPPRQLRERSFSRALFHAPSSTTQARFASTKVDPEDTLYRDDQRIVHTGPNPLHN